MRYIKPQKLKVMLAAFMGTGVSGIALGTAAFGALSEFYNPNFYLSFLGTINLCLGGVVGWLLLTQTSKRRDSRKPSRN